MKSAVYAWDAYKKASEPRERSSELARFTRSVDSAISAAAAGSLRQKHWVSLKGKTLAAVASGDVAVQRVLVVVPQMKRSPATRN